MMMLHDGFKKIWYSIAEDLEMKAEQVQYSSFEDTMNSHLRTEPFCIFKKIWYSIAEDLEMKAEQVQYSSFEDTMNSHLRTEPFCIYMSTYSCFRQPRLNLRPSRVALQHVLYTFANPLFD